MGEVAVEDLEEAHDRARVHGLEHEQAAAAAAPRCASRSCAAAAPRAAGARPPGRRRRRPASRLPARAGRPARSPGTTSSPLLPALADHVRVAFHAPGRDALLAQQLQELPAPAAEVHHGGEPLEEGDVGRAALADLLAAAAEAVLESGVGGVLRRPRGRGGHRRAAASRRRASRARRAPPRRRSPGGRAGRAARRAGGPATPASGRRPRGSARCAWWRAPRPAGRARPRAAARAAGSGRASRRTRAGARARRAALVEVAVQDLHDERVPLRLALEGGLRPRPRRGSGAARRRHRPSAPTAARRSRSGARGAARSGWRLRGQGKGASRSTAASTSA